MISCIEVVGLSLSAYLKIDIDYLKYRSSIILIVTNFIQLVSPQQVD